MQQWREVKARNRDALVFFRVGDFYELFYQDAEEGSKLLGLTLTSRNNGAAARVPLAGLPVKAVDEYLARAVRLGRRVAICEQVEDPAEAKGIVRREVVETVTPGTVLHDALLPARRNNFLLSVVPGPLSPGRRMGLAALDLSTGEFTLLEIRSDDLMDELGRLDPAEILAPRSWADELVPGDMPPLTVREDWVFDRGHAGDELVSRYGVNSLEGFGFQEGDELLERAAGALVSYVAEIQPSGLSHLQPPRILRSGSEMALDEMTRRNLELVESLRPGQQGGTLLDVVDRTVTAMGARLLRQWVLRPLVEPEEIWARQAAVEELHDDPSARAGLRELLERISDLERLAGKVGTGRASPRDLLGIRRSLEVLPDLSVVGARASCALLTENLAGADLLDDVRNLLDRAIHPDAPATLQEGRILREGYSPDLD
jgi:DNA mismatch repair protein MutS